MTILPKPRGLKLRISSANTLSATRRSRRVVAGDEYARIDYDTRTFVWKRDGGCCRHCGATTDLQFDHIVPRSKGGSGRAENVELLCGYCNNKKKAGLHAPLR